MIKQCSKCYDIAGDLSGLPAQGLPAQVTIQVPGHGAAGLAGSVCPDAPAKESVRAAAMPNTQRGLSFVSAAMAAVASSTGCSAPGTALGSCLRCLDFCFVTAWLSPAPDQIDCVYIVWVHCGPVAALVVTAVSMSLHLCVFAHKQFTGCVLWLVYLTQVASQNAKCNLHLT